MMITYVAAVETKGHRFITLCRVENFYETVGQLVRWCHDPELPEFGERELDEVVLGLREAMARDGVWV